MIEPYVPDDRVLRAMLREARTIAVVGLSSNPARPSNDVARYLKERGYRVIPVNPNEEEVVGERAYPSLSVVPEPIDIVDVFRRAEETPDVAREAVVVGASALWLQEDIVNEEARRIAEEGGLTAVMGVCIKTEHQRLHEEEGV